MVFAALRPNANNGNCSLELMTMTMTLFAAQTLTVLRLLPRAALITLLLAAPVLAVPMARGEIGTTIDAPKMKKKGMGFVLMVSLQRG
jgi:hypothetical protein